jgi:heptosyltransferase-2/heptosyltransferase-3
MKRTLRLALLNILALIARPFVRQPVSTLRNILYIKPDHLGDLLLATPVLNALRARFPEARITALVGPWSAIVLERNPDIDVLLMCPFPGFARRMTNDEHGAAERRMRRKGTADERRMPDTSLPLSVARRHNRQHAARKTQDATNISPVIRRLSALIQPYLILIRYALLLRATRYDIAIIGRDDHWWGAALALLAGIPYRVGFATPECRPFLSTALPWNPHEHITTQGLALVAAAEAMVNRPWSIADRGRRTDSGRTTADERRRTTKDGKGGSTCPPDHERRITARFDPAPADIQWAEEWLCEQKVASGEQLIVIHPGTGGPTKLWPAERWAAVGDALRGETGVRILITGGPGEEALVERVATAMRHLPITLAGRASFGQLAAILQRATLVLGVDSGPLHLAAALGVPSLHLFGPSDAERFSPWGDRAQHVIMRAGIYCSPCNVFSACPRGLTQPECMTQIDASRVIAAAQQISKTNDGRRTTNDERRTTNDERRTTDDERRTTTDN